jgi:hypothetical protein
MDDESTLPNPLPELRDVIPALAAHLFGTPFAISVHYRETSFRVGGAVEARDETDTEGGDGEDLQWAAEPLSDAESHAWHEKWAGRREKVVAGLLGSPITPQRLTRFLSCGSNAQVLVSLDDGSFTITGRRCRDRWCEICSGIRSRIIAANLAELCGRSPTKLVTMTLLHSHQRLRDQIHRLMEAFAILRRHRLWRQRVDAGAYFIEVKRAKNGRGWHPHLHVVMKALYIPQLLLADMWLQATGDSYRLWIEQAKGGCDASVSYATKYATKGYDRGVVDHPKAVRVCIASLRSVRLWDTFGGWRGIRLALRNKVRAGSRTLWGLDEAVYLAQHGDVAARNALASIGREWGVNLLNCQTNYTPGPAGRHVAVKKRPAWGRRIIDDAARHLEYAAGLWA